ncbi:MAG: ABC transporter ATP-binding protein [Gaiellaceae bacterium]
MTEAPALETHGLSKSFGPLRALDELDLTLPAGAVLGFLGPNGAGKTTAIRIVTTILEPDSGSFTVAGIPHTRPVAIRQRVGVLPESAGYPDRQTGEEFLRYFARLFGHSRESAKAVAGTLLAEMGLAERGGTEIKGYSRGMRQRLGIARALVNEPAVVFLDEPTLGLDPGGQRQVLELIKRSAETRGATVVLSTHLLAEVEEVCTRVVILNRGRVVADGTVAEIVRRAAAPRHARIQVAPEKTGTALDVLQRTRGIEAAANGKPGEVDLILSAGDAEAGATQALRALLEADIAVLGLVLEGGRLSDAFLTMTEER